MITYVCMHANLFRTIEPGEPVIFMFLSEIGLRLLRENRRWTMDGTFFCCPKGFFQLYTINVFKGDSSLPCMYALLPDKTEATYLRMFNVLKKRDNRLKPRSVMAG